MKTSLLFFRGAASIFTASILVWGMTGCLSKPALTKQTFIFDAATGPSVDNAGGDQVLGIRKLQIAAPFEGRSLVYRTGESAYVRDPYAEFLDWPADEMIVSVRKRLRSSGVFGSVVETGSALKPNTLVEISVSQLYGDFRQKDHPQAILTMRFVFLSAPNGIADKVLFQKEYTRRLSLKTPAADALMDGWNQALAEILREVASDFHRSEAGKTPQ